MIEICMEYSTWGSFGQHSAQSYVFVHPEKGVLSLHEALNLKIIRLKEDKSTRSRKNVDLLKTFELVEAVGVIRVKCYASSSKHKHELEVMVPGDFEVIRFEEEKYVVRMKDGREFLFKACARGDTRETLLHSALGRGEEGEAGGGTEEEEYS